MHDLLIRNATTVEGPGGAPGFFTTGLASLQLDFKAVRA